MPVNTAYLGIAVSATSRVNTPYMRTGEAGFPSDVSIAGELDQHSMHTQAGFRSFHTTASAASTVLPDGAFGIYFESASSCRLCFRSGSTTYTWIADTGAVL